MHGLMADSKLRIIQSYEQGLVPTGLDKRVLPTAPVRVTALLEYIDFHFLNNYYAAGSMVKGRE